MEWGTTMELNQLRYFKAVAEYGSISRAAKALYITQPALSKVIARLEGEVGTKLFERTKDGMKLNLSGVRMLQCANTVFTELEQCIVDLKENMQCKMSIVASKSYGWDSEMDRFQALHPNANISYAFQDGKGCVDAIKNGRYSVALTEGPVPGGGEELYHLKWCVMAHRDHPVMKKGIASLEALANELISVGNERDRAFTQELFRANHVAPRAFLDADKKESSGKMENYINRCVAVGIVPYDIFYTLKVRNAHTPICALPLPEVEHSVVYGARLHCSNGFPDTPEERELLLHFKEIMRRYWETVESFTEANMGRQV